MLICSVFVAAGERQDEGDPGEGAEDEATSDGVAQSPEGVCLDPTCMHPHLTI